MDPTVAKEKFHQLIAGDQLNEAAEGLAEYWKENNEPLAALSLAQLRRLKTLQTQQTKGTVSDNDAFVERAKITDALLSICTQIDAAKPTVPDAFWEASRPESSLNNKLWIALVGLALVIAGIFVFRSFSGESQPGAFDLTLGFHETGDPGKMIREGKVKVLLGDRDLGEKPIDPEGKVHFYHIPGEAGSDSIQVIPVEMPFRVARQSAWAPEQNHNITVEMTPVQQIIRWRGKVINGKLEPVENAVVDVESGLASGKTDKSGNFEIEAPKREQVQVTVMVDGRMVRNARYVLSETVPVTIVLDED